MSAVGSTPKAVMFAGADATERGLLHYAQREAGISLHMIFVRSAAEAIAYLGGEGRLDDRQTYPLPEILVLDISKPRMNRWEVPDWLKTRPDLSHIRFCFIGANKNRATRQKAESYGHCFFTRPENMNSYKELLKALHAEKLEPIAGPPRY